MIPDAVVEEVRAHADIVDVIGEIVPLKKAGKDYRANCPFHEERTPSFYVVPSKGFYNCFGCGESGDVFSFVMKRLGMDFVEAVKHVAQRSGIEVTEVGRADAGQDPFQAHYEANAFAADFFSRVLWDEREGRDARDYLDRRGIDPETARRFGLGFAPNDWRRLREAAGRHGISDELLLEVGLLTTSERSPEPYDRFRNRITFPIEGLSGRIVAFGGRVLGPDREGSPKYLNSPETPVYQKGRVLYGLSWARHSIRREGSALVVEGYMDAVSLAAAGIQNVVATLGTAMTEEQASLLGRYCRQAQLLYDSDRAGLRATFRAGDILLAAGVHPSVVTLPPGEDPDSVVRELGAQKLREFVAGAVDVLDRKLQILEERSHFDTIDRTRAAVDRLMPTIRATLDPTLRDIYVAKVAERTGVRRETLESEIDRPLPARARPASPSGKRARVPEAPSLGAERNILLLLLKDPERVWIDRAVERIGFRDFEDPHYGAIFRALVADPELRRPTPDMDPVTAARLEELLSDPVELAPASRIFDDSVGRILGQAIDRRLAELDAEIRTTEGEGERRALLEEKARLGLERRQVDPTGWKNVARRGLGTGPAETGEERGR